MDQAITQNRRGHGGDQLHFLTGGARLRPETKVPMVPRVHWDANDLPHHPNNGRFMTRDDTHEMESGCAGCGYHHRADFSGDCRNDHEAYDDYDDGMPYARFGFEPDYVCADGKRWISRHNQQRAFDAGVA